MGWSPAPEVFYCVLSVGSIRDCPRRYHAKSGSSSIVEISIPTASFRSKSLEALDGLSKILDKEIGEFIQEQETFPGIMASFNQFGFNTMGAVETELMVGRDKINELRQRTFL